MPELRLSIDEGLHIPVIPFVDIAGNTGTAAPVQADRDTPKLKVGVIFGLTVTVNVVDVAQVPATGVNVYIPEAWSSTVAGFHVPSIPFVDVVDSTGTIPPAQIVSDEPKLNTGMIFGSTVTVNVVVVAHCPAVGVNV